MRNFLSKGYLLACLVSEILASTAAKPIRVSLLCVCVLSSTLSQTTSLVLSKLKADNKLSITQKIKFIFHRVENNMG